MIIISCDHIDENFHKCPAEMLGMAFNAKPEGWEVKIINKYGDHLDYCPDHRKAL